MTELQAQARHRDAGMVVAMGGHWHSVEQGKLAELLMEYAPQPPFGVGRPDLALPETVGAAESMLTDGMPAALIEAATRLDPLARALVADLLRLAVTRSGSEL